jgi:hypothetical protein
VVFTTKLTLLARKNNVVRCPERKYLRWQRQVQAPKNRGKTYGEDRRQGPIFTGRHVKPTFSNLSHLFVYVCEIKQP